ncbi:peptidyl-prolyl cis-trans isomerase [Aureococcus anophagefferens]|nr:peptidyl-prolyl cis-trans isomerase [Aureococcus anophagefferens]
MGARALVPPSQEKRERRRLEVFLVGAALSCGALLACVRYAAPAARPLAALAAQTTKVDGAQRCAAVAVAGRGASCGDCDGATAAFDMSRYPAAAAACGAAPSAACLWEALARLPETCAGTFDAAAAAAPRLDGACDCGVAAFCASGCGEGNAYCDAFVAQHPALAALDAPGAAADALWRDEAHWCSPDVLGAIADGAFEPAEALFDDADRAVLLARRLPPLFSRRAATMTNRHNPPVIVGKRDENPIVFFDIAIGDRDVGRIIIELRSDLCPRTCENFRALCTGAHRSPPVRAREVALPGERGKSKEDKVPLHYKGSKLHRIVNDSHCQGGDIRNGDGTWSGCTFGDNTTFEDENFILRKKEWDEKHVVFGFAATHESLQVLYAIDQVGSPSGKPSTVPVIKDCGQLFPKR